MNTGKLNKVYYGEYSIEYWISLLLNRNIDLPEYQRSFVWEADDVKALVETIAANRFVPPITIGSFKCKSKHSNYIVDGQQRLTSILLAVLGVFPDKKKWEEAGRIAAERDEGEGRYADDGYGETGAIQWTYRELLSEGVNTLDEVRKRCEESGKYIKIKPLNLAEYGKSRCIGFSYLVPADDGNNIDYYANVFMDINGSGIGLSDQETRRSLYFLDKGLDMLFEPPFLREYGITRSVVKNSGASVKITERIDFVRYLSIMNEYMVRARQNPEHVNMRKVAVGYRKNSENYHKSFIRTVAGREDGGERFCPNANWAHGGDFKTMIEALKESLSAMGVPHIYDSIADMDIAFFGIIYWVCYCGKSLDELRREEFGRALRKVFASFRSEPNYLKSSSQMGKLRERVEQSVNFYRGYLANG